MVGFPFWYCSGILVVLNTNLQQWMLLEGIRRLAKGISTIVLHLGELSPGGDGDSKPNN